MGHSEALSAFRTVFRLHLEKKAFLREKIAFKDPGEAFDCKERVPVVGFAFGGLGDSEWEKNEKNLVSWDL